MLAKSEVMCSMPPSAAWKARLFCISWPPTLPSVFTIMSRPIAIPDIINSSIRVAIRVNPRESSFLLRIVSLLVAIQPCSFSLLIFSPLISRSEDVTILITQVSRADRSLGVESLIAFGNHEAGASAGHLAAGSQMNQIDFANQIEGCAG